MPAHLRPRSSSAASPLLTGKAVASTERGSAAATLAEEAVLDEDEPPEQLDGPLLSDPDDFVIYSMDEAAHIAYAIDEAFKVELSNEVVLAAANVAKLAKRVVEARRLLFAPSSSQASPALDRQ